MAQEDTAVQINTALTDETQKLLSTEQKSSWCCMFKRTPAEPQLEMSEFEKQIYDRNVTRAGVAAAIAVVGVGMTTLSIVYDGSFWWDALGAVIAMGGAATTAGSLSANCKKPR
ncbi:MAG TPA: hypothetical protein VGV92_03730 [Gammaproteobacteria bacterium]|nr:hypothetical protein [Gammaproteobacteria bacterium]